MSESTMATPSLQLANKILDRLVNENLLAEDDRVKLGAKLADGTLKSEDWRLAIEIAQAREQKP